MIERHSVMAIYSRPMQFYRKYGKMSKIEFAPLIIDFSSHCLLYYCHNILTLSFPLIYLETGEKLIGVTELCLLNFTIRVLKGLKIYFIHNKLNLCMLRPCQGCTGVPMHVQCATSDLCTKFPYKISRCCISYDN